MQKKPHDFLHANMGKLRQASVHDTLRRRGAGGACTATTHLPWSVKWQQTIVMQGRCGFT